jgi:predicted RNase H-like nuclease
MSADRTLGGCRSSGWKVREIEGEKIDNQQKVACFEISFILLTQLTADISSAVFLVVGRSVSKTA